MKSGDSIKFIRSEGAPLQSDTLPKVIASLVAGFSYSSNKPLLDTVEDDGQGGLKREHTWTFRGDEQVEFLPEFQPERIDLHEFWRRFDDAAWCKANPHHPIAYLRAFSDYRAQVVAQVKQMKPLEKIERGHKGSRSILLIPQSATTEERAQMLRDFNKA